MDDFSGIVVACLIGAGVAVVTSIPNMIRQSDQKKYKSAYNNALERISNDPTNPSLRLQALQAGRKYYSSLRKDNRVSIYDETAIQNDINAVSGGK